MEFQQALTKLTSSTKFKEWHEQNRQYFLAHGFMMMDDEEWQIGWYNADKKLITTFIINNTITQTHEQEALIKDKINKLDPSKIKLSYHAALQKAETAFTKHKEPVLKKFFIIQNTGKNTVYNITYFTQSYNTFNVHINAENGDMLNESKQRLLDFT